MRQEMILGTQKTVKQKVDFTFVWSWIVTKQCNMTSVNCGSIMNVLTFHSQTMSFWKTDCTWIYPKYEMFNSSVWFSVNLEKTTRFLALIKYRYAYDNFNSPCRNKPTSLNGLKLSGNNINSIRGKTLELIAFLDFYKPDSVLAKSVTPITHRTIMRIVKKFHK